MRKIVFPQIDAGKKMFEWDALLYQDNLKGGYVPYSFAFEEALKKIFRQVGLL